MKLEKLIPELIVSDLPKMIDFYIKNFGFELEATDPEEKPYNWVQLSNGDCTIMMQELEATKVEISDIAEQILGTDLLMIKAKSIDDVKKLYIKIEENFAEVYMPIRVTEYDSCEFGIKDPEGRYIIVSG